MTAGTFRPSNKEPPSKQATSLNLRANSRIQPKTPGLPFAHLNLRRNPFGELPNAERARLAVIDLDQLLSSLTKPKAALQVIGDCGRGKTTRLLALERALPQALYFRIPEPPEPCPLIPEATVLLIDEAQFLSHPRRWRLWRRPGKLVLGTHRDLSLGLRSARRPVTSIRAADLSNTALAEVFHRRIEAQRRDSGPIPKLSAHSLKSLRRRHGNNLRAMESELYKVFQRLQEISDVEV